MVSFPTTNFADMHDEAAPLLSIAKEARILEEYYRKRELKWEGELAAH